MTSLKKLQRYLDEHYTGCYVMPSNKKGSKYPHRNGKWSSEKSYAHMNECVEGAVILLNEKLIVVDIDDPAWVSKIESDFPEFLETVQTETKKGKHYYFKRTEECGGGGLGPPLGQFMVRDGARQMYDENSQVIPIDIKTITGGTGDKNHPNQEYTRGVISIHPSVGKKWVKELGKYDPIDFSTRFLEYYKEGVQNKKRGVAAPMTPSITECSDISYSISLSQMSNAVNNDEIEFLVSILSSERAKHYTDWMSVGWALKNTGDYFYLWDEFSKLCPEKYVAGECQRLWEDMKYQTNGLTKGSLKMWAKQDNEKEYSVYYTYKEIFDNSIDDEIISELISHYVKGTYVCTKSDHDKCSFVKYNGTRWDTKEARSDLVQYIREKISHYVHQEIFKYQDKNKVTKLKKVSELLRNTSYSKKVLDHMGLKLTDYKLPDKLDSNIYLLGFENGVYDFNMQAFRASKQTDYVSMTTGYNYNPEKNEKIYEEVKGYWKKMHPEDDKREYILRMFARQLYGDGVDNLFHLHAGFCGSASNGKSSFFEKILQSVLGDYIRQFPISVLVRKEREAANKASPELAVWKGVRILYSSEPNSSHEKLNSGILKQLTGNEAIIYRRLFENEIRTIIPQYSMHIMCNNPPEVDGVDQGIIRRIRKIDYMSRFVAKQDVDESQHMYESDSSFIEKVLRNDEYKMEFLRYILDHYEHNVKLVDICPDCVITASQEYLSENNEILEYVREYIQKGTSEDFFTLKDLKEDFSERKKGVKIKLKVLKQEVQNILKCEVKDQKIKEGINYKNVFEGYTIIFQ